MAALCSRCGHYILQVWFLSFFLLFFPHLPYFHTWCGLSADLECRSEICCTRLAQNTGCKKERKKSPAAHHRTILSSYIFATKACIDNRKKLFQQQYLLHMSSQYDELQPTNGWDWLGSLWHPSKFDGFRVLVSLLHRRSAEANQTLQHGTRNGTTELCLGLYSEGGHHVGRRPTF